MIRFSVSRSFPSNHSSPNAKCLLWHHPAIILKYIAQKESNDQFPPMSSSGLASSRSPRDSIFSVARLALSEARVEPPITKLFDSRVNERRRAFAFPRGSHFHAPFSHPAEHQAYQRASCVI